MAEVKVNREKSPARQETPGSRLPGELFRPMFPLGRHFGLSPFALMREFSEEMDRIFGASGATGETTMWSPAVDVQRTDGSLVITAELPGLKKDEVKVELTEDALVIEGERKREQKEEREGFSLENTPAYAAVAGSRITLCPRRSNLLTRYRRNAAGLACSK